MTQKNAEDKETFIKLLKNLDTLMKQNDTITPEICRQGHRILNTSAVRVVKDNQNIELEARSVCESMGMLQFVEKFIFSAEEKEVLEKINQIGHSGSISSLGHYPGLRMY